jgi:FkbM family methyltransferase
MTDSPAIPSFKALTDTRVRIKAVNIGANDSDGHAPPYAGLLAAGDVDVVGFEPNLKALAELNARKGPCETYLPHAIGDGGRHTLNICFAPGMTSLLKPNPAVLKLFHAFPGWGQVLSTETLDTVRLDDIAETAGAELLKIDIQGGELMAMRHAEARLRDLLVIHTEVEFLPMYVDQPLFSDIDLFLRQHGFVFHKFEPTVSRTIAPMLVNNDIYAGMSQLLWADAIFVKDFTRLDLFTERQLLGMAAIMHDCYRSFDLALRLLTEHDARAGTQLGATYLSRLQTLSAAKAA